MIPLDDSILYIAIALIIIAIILIYLESRKIPCRKCIYGEMKNGTYTCKKEKTELGTPYQLRGKECPHWKGTIIL